METSERLVRLQSRGLGTAGESIVAAAEGHGYTVVATGPNSFRLVRTARPKWATIAAVVCLPLLGLGLLFLFVKTTEHAVVTVYEDRDGAKARVVGDVSPQMIEALETGAAAPVSQASEPKPTTTSPVGGASAGTTMIGAVPSASASKMNHPPPAPADAPVFPGSTPDVDDRTVSRAELAANTTTATSPSPTTPSITLNDGRTLAIGGGLVLGRNPVTPQGWPPLTPVALADPSVSKSHAAITLSDEGPQITDLFSTNGCSISSGDAMHTVPAGARLTIPGGAGVILGDLAIHVST